MWNWLQCSAYLCTVLGRVASQQLQGRQKMGCVNFTVQVVDQIKCTTLVWALQLVKCRDRTYITYTAFD